MLKESTCIIHEQLVSNFLTFTRKRAPYKVVASNYSSLLKKDWYLRLFSCILCNILPFFCSFSPYHHHFINLLSILCRLFSYFTKINRTGVTSYPFYTQIIDYFNMYSPIITLKQHPLMQ